MSGYSEVAHETPSFERSPLRVRAIFALARVFVAGHFEVEGTENLEQIEPDEPLVVAASHHTDVDVPFVAHALAKRMDIAVTDMSLNHHFSLDDPTTNLAIMIAGKDRILPIDYRKHGKDQAASTFNAGNFEPAIQAIEQGRRVITAAYKPYKHRDNETIKPGISAPYLAAATEAKVLPVAVVMHDPRNLAFSETMLKTILIRPDFSIRIGQPITLPEIENFSQFKQNLMDRKTRERKSESNRISDVRHTLKEHGQELVSVLESLRQ